MEQEAEWLPVFAFPVFFWNPVVSDVFATNSTIRGKVLIVI
jgi:hypothetical protein